MKEEEKGKEIMKKMFGRINDKVGTKKIGRGKK